MKATDIIARDHRAAEALFEEYKNASDEKRGELEKKIFAALAAHEKMEDEHFYPALKEVLEDDDMLEELEREQTVLKMEVAGIALLPLGRDEALVAAMEQVLDHARKEEEQIFPKAEELLGATRLEELGTLMEPESAVALEAREG